MILAMTVPIAFTVPLNREAHQIARDRSECQFSPQRAKRAYLNSLAVYAVRFYLNCMEIDADGSEESEVSLTAFKTFSTITLSGLGKLECCPVLSRESSVRLPAETWGDRVGYVAVQFDESFTVAKLLGFLAKTTDEIVSIDRFSSLETFLIHLDKLETLQKSSPVTPPVRLHQWLQDTIESGWETLESLFGKTQWAWRYRSVRTAAPPRSVTRAKLLDLTPENRVALEIELVPIENSEIEIWVRVYPVQSHIDLPKYLPENLKLSILDELGTEVIQAEARSTEEIQVKFIVDLGEMFGVRVALGEAIVTESFLV